MNNQAYLLAEQYRDDSNLASRMSLHERFSTNPYGFQRWIFDRLDLAPDARVLELGCGTGVLWLKNRDRLPEGWNITLSDLSSGMLPAKDFLNGARLEQLKRTVDYAIARDGAFRITKDAGLFHCLRDRPPMA